MDKYKHYAAGITAFIIWGFFSIPLRALSDYTSGEILYFRIVFSLGILLIVVGFFRRKRAIRDLGIFRSMTRKEKRNVIFLTLAGAVLLTINWLTFIHVVNNINVKTASFSYLICPVITAVLGYVLIKERLTALQWSAVLLCAVSCALIGLGSMVELGYSVFTAFTYALYLITQRKNQGFDRLLILGIQVLSSFAILSCMVGYLVQTVPAASSFYVIIFSIAMFFTVIPLFLNLYALNRLSSATIGILMYLNPIINFTVAFVFFKEKVSTVQIIGYAIIFIALIIFNLPNIRKIRTALASPQ